MITSILTDIKPAALAYTYQTCNEKERGMVTDQAK